MQPRQVPPEHPYPEYAPPSGPLRFLTRIREHGFALAIAVTLLGVIFVFREFNRLDQADPGELAIPIHRGPTAPARTAGAPVDSLAVLSVQTYPDGAEIYLDGTSLGLAPIEQVRLAPGTYHLSFEKPTYAPIDSIVTLGGGESALLVIPLGEARTEGPRGGFEIASVPVPRAEESAPPARRTRRDRPPETRPSPPAAPPPAEPVPTIPQSVPVAQVQNPTTGRMELRSEPEGAAVWLDRRFIGYTPLSLANVAPGEHVLTFRKLGYESPTTVVGLEAGHTLTVNPRLAALAGTLRVLAKPWGTIYVNGELKQEATNVRYSADLPPGNYRVTVVHPVLGRWETVAEIQAGKEASFVVDFNDRDPSRQVANNVPDSG